MADGSTKTHSGVTSINTFDDIEAANKNAQGNITNIESKQRRIKESDRYRGSAAARDAGKSSK